MTQLFVKFDVSTNTVTAGPQAGMADQVGWYAFVPAPDRGIRDEVEYIIDDDEGAVAQYVVSVAGDPEYREARGVSYPSIANQLDSLFHDIDNGTLNNTGEFYTAIQAVKNTYPKA